MRIVYRMPEADSADVVKNYALEVEIPEIYLSKLPEEHRECVRQILAGDPRPSYQNDPGPGCMEWNMLDTRSNSG